MHTTKHGFAHFSRAQNVGGVDVTSLIPPAVLIRVAVGAVFVRFNFGEPKLGQLLGK